MNKIIIEFSDVCTQNDFYLWLIDKFKKYNEENDLIDVDPLDLLLEENDANGEDIIMKALKI